MIKKVFKDNRGISLVELLAAISIMGFILATIFIVQNQFFDIYDEVQSGSEQNEEASFFIEFFSDQVRKSNHIMIDNNDVTLSLYSGDSLQFIYNVDSNTNLNKVTYINEKSVSIDLLKNITDFSVEKTSDGKGIDISFELINDGKKITLSTKVYSNVGIVEN